MNSNTLSIVVVTYNSARYIDNCLSCLSQAAHYSGIPVEILVVDNASTDDTKARIASQSGIRVIENTTNLGFGAAANRGIFQAHGTWIMVVNPDTTCDTHFLQVLMKDVTPYTTHLINPLILRPDATVNAAGLIVHYTGIAVCNGLGAAPAHFSRVATMPVASPSGAAIIAHRQVWTALRGFDEEYFLYMEDVDLGLRAQSLGYECVCLPSATIYHDYALRLTPAKLYYLERNRLMMIHKLYSHELRRRIAWSLRIVAALAAISAALHGWAYWKAFTKAHQHPFTSPLPTRDFPPLTHILPTMARELPLEVSDSPWVRAGLRCFNRVFYRLLSGRQSTPKPQTR
ncbi:MAG: glycosyltransferase family 2 protein [Sulfobacillus acidophilus]|uniref:Glycosyltransferase family 2 protein n=1 Tax=Sulfobacillus acidophilus TaxID=53633 RepID=A0A2T2WNZ4_9FIRM|nr:MAG: glycosyltransferase family 2 protein [Sulfobacillus acidophilus]